MLEAGRFLVVEDEPVVATSLRRGIERRALGHVVIANTADQTRDRITDGSAYTAMIIDITLDGAPVGLDLLAEARKAGHGLTPALVLSGSNERIFVNRAAALEAKYLVKPVEWELLALFLTDSISLSRRLDAALRTRGLTDALADVVKRSVLGEDRDAIAAARGTSRRTVDAQAETAARVTGDQSFQALLTHVLRDVARSR